MRNAIHLIRLFPVDARNLSAYFQLPEYYAKWTLGQEASVIIKTPHRHLELRDLALEGVIKLEFSPTPGGTRLSLTQSGFSSAEKANEAELLWHQRLSALWSLIDDHVEEFLLTGN